MKHSIKLAAIAALGTSLLLQGCMHDEKSAHRAFTVAVTNLSSNQPFSPVAAVLHKSGYNGFALGGMASNGLEQLAEGGDNSAFITEAGANNKVLESASGVGIITPGGSESLQVLGLSTKPRLTLASMLVNTNDAFIGLNDVDLSELGRDESLVLHARVYDAGTEANSETVATIPGPAAGGEGFNAARDDRDFIAIHPGVVSQDDSLTTSALDASHRFDNPGAKIVITRTE